MDLKKIKTAATRGWATIGIATNIATVPITKDGTPTLTKQYAKHAKEVQLPQNRRTSYRNTTKTFTPAKALDKRNAKKLRKP